jgi:hypothetical protein
MADTERARRAPLETRTRPESFPTIPKAVASLELRGKWGSRLQTCKLARRFFLSQRRRYRIGRSYHPTGPFGVPVAPRFSERGFSTSGTLTWRESRSSLTASMSITHWMATRLGASSSGWTTVRAVRELFVGKQIGVVVPIGRRSEELKRECDFHFRMREDHLRRCQLPDVVDGGPFGELHRPDSWK